MAEFDYEVVNGRKIRVRPQEVVSEIDENGYFVRQPNHFTEGFGEGKNPVEKGRYHLVWAKLCHWSNRASIVRELLGLEDAISVNMVDHAKHEKNLGWEFVYDKDHIDPVLGIQFLSEAYYKADDDYTGRTTVPALIDTKTGKVVNNDYTWLTNYFEVDFKPFHKKGAPDLYPEELRKDIDEMNEYLFGDRLTESDVRLYVTLVRFDCAYYPVFRLNKKLLRDYPNLWAYARDLYQTPGFGDTTNFAAIKKHYHIDCCPSNEFAIVPNGPDESLWLTPHGREKLSGK